MIGQLARLLRPVVGPVKVERSAYSGGCPEYVVIYKKKEGEEQSYIRDRISEVVEPLRYRDDGEDQSWNRLHGLTTSNRENYSFQWNLHII